MLNFHAHMCCYFNMVPKYRSFSIQIILIFFSYITNMQHVSMIHLLSATNMFLKSGIALPFVY